MVTTKPAPGPGQRPARLAVLFILLAAVVGFYLSGLHRDWTLERLKGNLDELKALVDANRSLAVLAFTAVYIAITGLSLPVAALLSLLAGALFGLWLGTGMVSVASTVGATIAMLSARYILRDWVQKRFSHRLATLNHGIEQDGAYYLLTLRLVPLIPFWLINLGMGLTPIRTRTFALVSWVGMLPGAILYVNAGTQLERINSPADVLSWQVIGSFAAMAVVPLVLKWLLHRKPVGNV